MSKSIKIFTLLTLGFYLLPLAQSIGTISVYLNNLHYISTELCTNKDKPQMHCEGTCVLAQMMNSKNKIPQNPFEHPENSITTLEILAFVFVEKSAIVTTVTVDNSLFARYILHYFYEPDSSLDQPPERLV